GDGPSIHPDLGAVAHGEHHLEDCLRRHQFVGLRGDGDEGAGQICRVTVLGEDDAEDQCSRTQQAEPYVDQPVRHTPHRSAAPGSSRRPGFLPRLWRGSARAERGGPGIVPPTAGWGKVPPASGAKPGVGGSGKRVRKARNDPLVSVGGPSSVPTMGSNTSSTGVRGLFESVDAAEQTLITGELMIATIRAMQLDAIAFLDRAQVATADGARTMTDWVAVKADVSPETARDLVQTARRTEDRPELREVLLDGEASFDRVVAASRITADTSELLLRHLDVSGVRREAARCRLITEHEEQRTFVDRFLVLQPSLDESWWRIFGGLDGVLGAVVDKALTEAADQLPDDPEAPKDSSWRRATALGLLAAGDVDTPAQLTVFVDTDQATPSSGKAGVYMESGPRI